MVFNIQNVDLTIEEKKILNNINISFMEKEFNAIVGPNGCGKSTLIKLLAKIHNPTNGKILYLNKELTNIKRKDFAKEVAFFFQFNDAQAQITVQQMVSYGRSAHKRLYENLNEKDNEIINQCISQCDLIDLQNRIISSLSGGERQRVYLAMTLAQEPDVIVLDEPTNHLDIKYQFQLLHLIRKIMKEKNLTIICILHDLNQVLKYADNTIVMKAGQIKYAGKTKDVVTAKMVKEIFEINSVVHINENGYHIDFIID